MFNADPYLAERSMALHVADARRQAAADRLGRQARAALARHWSQRAVRRLALALVALGGRLVLAGLPPYVAREAGQANGKANASLA
jgi:hypothetical protein